MEQIKKITVGGKEIQGCSSFYVSGFQGKGFEGEVSFEGVYDPISSVPITEAAHANTSNEFPITIHSPSGEKREATARVDIDLKNNQVRISLPDMQMQQWVKKEWGWA